MTSSCDDRFDDTPKRVRTNLVWPVANRRSKIQQRNYTLASPFKVVLPSVHGGRELSKPLRGIARHERSPGVIAPGTYESFRPFVWLRPDAFEGRTREMQTLPGPPSTSKSANPARPSTVSLEPQSAFALTEGGEIIARDDGCELPLVFFDAD